jgi:hypothetical protein
MQADDRLIELTDAAPVIMAKELSLFASEHLDVALSLEPSWATLADIRSCIKGLHTNRASDAEALVSIPAVSRRRGGLGAKRLALLRGAAWHVSCGFPFAGAH